MSIAIVCTGTELLKGCAVNTNAAYLGKMLMAAGIPPVMEISIPDHPDEMVNAFATALKCADTLIITGGLGPTADDLTLDTAARFFGVELYEDAALHDKITEFWGRHHPGKCPKMQYRQARVPEGGEILPNPVGSASGIGFHPVYGGRQRHIFLLPGPPHEFEPMAQDFLLPRLLEVENVKLHTKGFLACGGESTVFAAAAKAVADLPVQVASAAGAGATRIFFSGSDETVVDQAVDAAHTALAGIALPPGKFDIAEETIEQLRAANATLGCAESCTGGLLAARFVAFPGVSDVFYGSITAYSNLIKEKQLQIPSALLAAHGAVSPECAEAMAKNCCQVLGCDYAISTTGVAGPDGGTPEKPVGLVYVAAASKDGQCVVKELRMRGNRRSICERAVEIAVLQLYKMLTGME